MQNSALQTYSVPSLGGASPSTLAHAGKAPMRVMVRNTGGGVIALAFEVNSLNDLSAIGGTYLLPGGQVDVFVLAPGQSLFAAALGGVGQASIAYSEAFPVTNWMES